MLYSWPPDVQTQKTYSIRSSVTTTPQAAHPTSVYTVVPSLSPRSHTRQTKHILFSQVRQLHVNKASTAQDNDRSFYQCWSKHRQKLSEEEMTRLKCQQTVLCVQRDSPVKRHLKIQENENKSRTYTKEIRTARHTKLTNNYNPAHKRAMVWATDSDNFRFEIAGRSIATSTTYNMKLPA
jgi:hypothetical protein